MNVINVGATNWTGTQQNLDVKPEIRPELKVETGIKRESFSEEQTSEKKNLEDLQEKLLMKPKPLPLEERLKMVISIDQMKDLLSLITRSGNGNAEDSKEKKLDIKL